MRIPDISILITVYNREKFVSEAIKSVLNSSYSNFELLIVDDCSTDSSYDIISEYSNIPNVKIFRNKTNLGQFKNRNYAASLAKGEYIKFLDSDDTIYPYGLEAMVSMIEEFPDAGAAISHDLLHESTPYPIYLNPRDAYKTFFIKGGFPNSGPSAAIIRREAFELLGGYSEPFYVGTDTIFWLKLCSKYPIVKIPPALNWYRRHNDQEIAKLSNEYLKRDYTEYLAILESKDCPLSNNEIIKAKEILKHRQVRKLLNIALKKRNPALAYSIFKESKLKLGDFGFVFQR